ncbi:MAG: hypothetical protein ABSG73_04100 [Candidatus Aminicenantales bacterium]|jgi:hypothetical protein
MKTTNSLQEAKRFIETLFSHYFKDHDGYVEVRLIKEDEGVRSVWLRKGKISEGQWQEICQLNSDGWHVYVGVAPRPLSQAKKQDDIEQIGCLWTDLDGKDFEGGKDEALKRIETFAITPSVIVDSGHGYHAYWILTSPVAIATEEDRLSVKRYLSGIVKALGGDRSKLNLDACLRLPETKNVKDAEPIDCHIVNFSSLVYSLDSFDHLKDTDFEEIAVDDEELPPFGTKTAVIKITKTDENEAKAEAQAQIEKLEIPAQTKRFIVSGALPQGKDVDRTASGRDFRIICSLIFCGYNYATIQSVFFNPHLGCSSRIRRRGEAILKWDVKKALKQTPQQLGEETPQGLAVDSIRLAKLTAAQKKKALGSYIVNDILLNPDAAGQGFRDVTNENRFFFFDNEDKTLMNVDSIDFYCYLRGRFGIFDSEVEEYRGLVKTVIRNMKAEVTPRAFSFWNVETQTLYVDNFKNQMYRLDGEEIRPCNNGTDGVFFETLPLASPFSLDEQFKPHEYFRTPKPEKTVVVAGREMKFPSGYKWGLDLEALYSEESLIKKFVIDRAPFETSSENPLLPGMQELLLVIYFYSLFFESQMTHKPIAVFIGIRESGKSTLSSSLGKIIFGPSFATSTMPKSAHDLAVVLNKAPYLVIDNVDEEPKGEMLDTLAAVATGSGSANRELYTSLNVAAFVPHSFIAITTRSIPFTRDDIVSRLLPFTLRHLEGGEMIPPSFLIETMMANRNKIWAEIIANLGVIVKILRANKRLQAAQGSDYKPLRCETRLADWETFGWHVTNFKTRLFFEWATQKTTKRKVGIALEGSRFWEVLISSLESGAMFRNVAPQDLYNRMCDAAWKMGIKDFQIKYTSQKAMMRHVAHIASLIREEIDFPEPIERGARKKFYTFKLKDDNRPDSEALETMGTDEEKAFGPTLTKEEAEKIAKMVKARENARKGAQKKAAEGGIEQ